MTKSTETEIEILKTQMTDLKSVVTEGFKESKEFHIEMREEIKQQAEERVQIATLKEKVKTLEKITWFALLTAIASGVKAFFDLVSTSAS